ncbi:fasciclin domain-containing protein [Lutibacter flavus]|uniref:Uncaracterized surface protein containing fasciclin (FAS1) repeats n=1 Tax=Lutibacter flavus TaxID=691689 RepID=A0A238YR46_9FLAO|nr:fasciclin domain-containing protein [Lutibacter flavus]SNR73161.1 Uncaracterized surface protein containing fasciclin (FAS1) repeats [Lutibacter flavus]
MKKNNLIFSLLIVIGFFITSCGNGEKKQEVSEKQTEIKPETQGQSGVIDDVSAANALQVAKSIADFSTLVAAIEAAGVEDAVVNVGPLTIFAPVNAAFDKLPEGTVTSLLLPENKAKLAFILVNHVAPANYPDTQLKKEAKKGRKLYMASGKYLVVEEKEDGLYVGGTKILKTVKVSNGWIHVIDNVLVPEA